MVNTFTLASVSANPLSVMSLHLQESLELNETNAQKCVIRRGEASQQLRGNVCSLFLFLMFESVSE